MMAKILKSLILKSLISQSNEGDGGLFNANGTIKCSGIVYCDQIIKCGA